MTSSPLRIAILDRGIREARRRSAPEESRFLPLFSALCEINASSVSPFPDSAIAPLAGAATQCARLRRA